MISVASSLVANKRSNRPFVGASPEARRLTRTIKRLSKTNNPVLLVGDVGTGKTFGAELIHSLSVRRNQPFLRLNCAALGHTIARNDLLGGKSADSTKTALLDQLGQGVLFLDNVSDLSSDFQSIILDLMRTKEDEAQARAIRFRIIAESSRDLAALVRTGRFNSDLYAAFAPHIVKFPPLCERKQDIPELLLYLLKQYCDESQIEIPAVPAEIFEYVMAYDWKGNVTELKNCVETLVMMSPRGQLCLDYLPFDVERHPLDFLEVKDLNKVTSQVEVFLIRKALEKFAGNQVKAARQLGIPEATLRFKIKKYAIEKGS